MKRCSENYPVLKKMFRCFLLIYILILGPEKRHIPHKVVDSGNGVFRIEFTTVEVGSYVIDVTVAGQ